LADGVAGNCGDRLATILDALSRPGYKHRRCRANGSARPTRNSLHDGMATTTGPALSHRLNEQIRLTPIRVIDHNGQMLGVIPTADALQIARDNGLDLVEVAPTERPPVCRILDFGKFKYEQKKKAQKSQKAHQTQLKEIRLRPKTGDHDIEFKMKQARQFLGERDKVKLNVFFRGRENAHHERGKEILADIIKQLEDIAKVEMPPRMEGGRNMTAVLTPK
jgi:translation initiation factor IF-3